MTALLWVTMSDLGLKYIELIAHRDHIKGLYTNAA